jgi:hypothetical protein
MATKIRNAGKAGEKAQDTEGRIKTAPVDLSDKKGLRLPDLELRLVTKSLPLAVPTRLT